ncbi:hypothetical protein SPSIL_044500 [Sporomusa silvacetica DSM 10669]|uniref:DUF1232 domain-containing protein n=1 Tax=Sporomusa silvacetica DSM 10669 TaxID=1123289 RepID=A0ABZ3IR95_9FIRM|nr:DUF1232 domain-containing protein [Sporomusa silvacetica]OZC20711.1 hypothetical protein SPSIL_15790 [Sporomusa silvacetica DSM 10669]
MIKAGRLYQFWALLKMVRENAMILFYAWRHPQTPYYLKGILTALVIYVLSPIDLLPDYLPLVGIADDVTLFTGAMLYLTNLLPAPVLTECRRQSEKWVRRMPYIFAVIAVAAVAWIVIVVMVVRNLMQ